jgi:hypothetical protein
VGEAGMPGFYAERTVTPERRVDGASGPNCSLRDVAHAHLAGHENVTEHETESHE